MEMEFHFQLTDRIKSEWVAFWHSCRHSHPRQHPLFAEVEVAKGRTPIFVIGKDNGEFVCAALFSVSRMLLGKRFGLEAVCLRGPAFDDIVIGRKFLVRAVNHFKTLAVGSIRVSPYWFFPGAEPVASLLHDMGFMPVEGPSNMRSSTGLVDLRRSNEEIFISISKSTRREIRRAERNQVTVRPAKTIEEARPFHDRLKQMNRERGLSAISYQEFEATFNAILINKEIGVLLNAYHDNTFLGGLWLVRSDHYSHASRYVVIYEAASKISNLSVGPILWWTGMQWAKERGCDWFDLEGYSERTEIGNPLYEVHKFKKRFSPLSIEIISEHRKVCNPLLYGIHRAGYVFLGSIRVAKQLLSRINAKITCGRKQAPQNERPDTTEG